MNIKIYTLTSPLHDAKAENAFTQKFLQELGVEHELKGDSFDDFGSEGLNLIYVRTGGTENLFLQLLPQLLKRTDRPFYLLASGRSNSLAASMEILSYLHENNLKGEIIHGSAHYMAARIKLLARVEEARTRLAGMRLGIVGRPSDWLISSQASLQAVKQKLGIELIDIPMQELLDACATLKDVQDATLALKAPSEAIKESIPGALRIYEALKTVVKRHELQGFSIRCFDLLTSVHNTGCIALAKFNSQGIVAGCEGDVPAMLSMAIVQAITGLTGFQSNPARINPETGEMLMAHCTIPFNLTETYELDTHFESGIGVGIRGYMKEGDVTIVKVSGDLSRHFVEEGQLLHNQAEPNLCRTQQVIQLNRPEKASYFLTNPIGNHHIIVPGHFKQEIDELLG